MMMKLMTMKLRTVKRIAGGARTPSALCGAGGRLVANALAVVNNALGVRVPPATWFFVLLAAPCVANTEVPAAFSSPQLEYARELRKAAGAKGALVDYVIDSKQPSEESFTIRRTSGGTEVIAGGPGGVLYGVQAALGKDVVDAQGTPDFELRGAVLVMLSPNWGYQSELSPERFPWFFDRALMTRYLDYLLSARLNTLIVWSGHLFPHIMELPEYPDATQFSREEVRRNQEQFRWLAEECAKRNITVLTHFYNIHISEHQAHVLKRPPNEAEKDATRYTVPDDFVRGYYRTILTKYFAEFPNVGLYICPGESLALDQQEPWFRDVIFKAAKDSGKNPKLIIRDWTLDMGFKAKLPSMYENLYSELKHNDETITSPWPDERHNDWKGVLKGHIVNLHDPADATPYRVGSPRLIGEMVGHWKESGLFKGAWFYPPQAWSWPGTLDVVKDASGKEVSAGLVAFERDPLWHLLEGRYLWKAERDQKAEHKWAAEFLGEKFANEKVGAALVEWYDLTGPILPGLQNVTAVRFGNFFPVSIAWVQATVDDILSYRTKIEDQRFQGPTGLTRQRYYSRPVDAYTVALYQKRYGVKSVRDLRSMPVAQLAEELAAGREPQDVMRADLLVDLYAEMAKESLVKAKAAVTAGGNNPEELQRFVNDSECLVLTAEYYRLKVRAALAKRLLELTDDAKYATELKTLMAESVAKYEAMFTHARKFYRAGSSMFDAKPWERAFNEKVKMDAELQEKWLAEFLSRKR